jgi:hypothetical protein
MTGGLNSNRLGETGWRAAGDWGQVHGFDKASGVDGDEGGGVRSIRRA